MRPHRGQGRSVVPDAAVAPHGVHQRVGGEGVVGGPGAHIFLEAFDDRPVGPGEPRSPQMSTNTGRKPKHLNTTQTKENL